jgi:hypothetical protein
VLSVKDAQKDTKAESEEIEIEDGNSGELNG